jgi:hypothetical protein
MVSHCTGGRSGPRAGLDVCWEEKIPSHTGVRRYFFFHQQLNLNLRKKLVECRIWSIAVYGVDTRTFRKVEHKYTQLESFEMCWRGMEEISWTYRVRNEYCKESRRIEMPCEQKTKKEV